MGLSVTGDQSPRHLESGSFHQFNSQCVFLFEFQLNVPCSDQMEPPLHLLCRNLMRQWHDMESTVYHTFQQFARHQKFSKMKATG